MMADDCAVKTSANRMTISRLAEACGVSYMTVHRVLRDDPKVADDTRRMVLTTAEKMGFAPKRLKRFDAAVRWNTYHVLFQNAYSLADAYFSEIILGIQAELFSRGRSCSFGVLTDSYPDFVRLTDMMADSTAGVFFVGDIQPSYARALQKSYGKVVFIDNPGGAAFCSKSL